MAIKLDFDPYNTEDEVERQNTPKIKLDFDPYGEETANEPIVPPDTSPPLSILPLQSKFPGLISKGIEKVGEVTGIKPVEEFGSAGLEYLQAEKPDFGKALSQFTESVTPEGYKDISTQFVKGLTWNYAPAVKTPAEASTMHKLASGTAYLAGMGLGLIPVSKALTGIGLLPKGLGIASSLLRGAELGSIYGLGAKPEEEESRFGNALKYAVMFGAFEGAGGLLTYGISKISKPVADVLAKIRVANENKIEPILSAKEKAINTAFEYGKSTVLGMGAGATEPAEDLQQRLINMGLGGLTFGGAHGITEGLGVLPKLTKRKLMPEEGIDLTKSKEERKIDIESVMPPEQFLRTKPEERPFPPEMKMGPDWISPEEVAKIRAIRIAQEKVDFPEEMGINVSTIKKKPIIEKESLIEPDSNKVPEWNNYLIKKYQDELSELKTERIKAETLLPKAKNILQRISESLPIEYDASKIRLDEILAKEGWQWTAEDKAFVRDNFLRRNSLFKEATSKEEKKLIIDSLKTTKRETVVFPIGKETKAETVNPQKLADAVGKSNQIEVLEKMGIKKPDEQIKQIVNDAVKSKITTANNLEANGKIKEASELKEKAFNEAGKLIEADGPITTQAVNEALKESVLPEKPKKLYQMTPEEIQTKDREENKKTTGKEPEPTFVKWVNYQGKLVPNHEYIVRKAYEKGKKDIPEENLKMYDLLEPKVKSKKEVTLKVMITNADKVKLSDLGYNKEDISKLRPQEAEEIINNNIVKPKTEQPSFDKSHVAWLGSIMETFEPARRVGVGEETKTVGGYPDWWKNKGYDKKKFIKTVDKVMKDEKLNPSEVNILDDLTESSLKDYQRTKKIEIEPDKLEEIEIDPFEKISVDRILPNKEAIEVIPYSNKLQIKNIEQLPKGLGTKYLLGIKGEKGDIIAKQWKRVLPNKLKKNEIIIDLGQPEEDQFLKTQEPSKPKIKPTQKDMFGVIEGTMEGKIPAEEAKFPLGEITKEIKQKKIEEEAKAKQEELPERKQPDLVNEVKPKITTTASTRTIEEIIKRKQENKSLNEDEFDRYYDYIKQQEAKPKVSTVPVEKMKEPVITEKKPEEIKAIIPTKTIVSLVEQLKKENRTKFTNKEIHSLREYKTEKESAINIIAAIKKRGKEVGLNNLELEGVKPIRKIEKEIEKRIEAKKKTKGTGLGFMGTQELQKAYETTKDFVNSGKPKDAFNHIVEIGKGLYSQGMQTFNAFVKGMKEILKDVYLPVRNQMMKAYKTVREWYRTLGAKGILDISKEEPVQPFYSKLEKTTSEIKQEKLTPEQIKGMLKDKVKKDEIADIGLDEFLKDKKSVSKQELIDYIKANKVKVQRRVKGGGKEPLQWEGSDKKGYQADDARNATWEVIAEDGKWSIYRNATLYKYNIKSSTEAKRIAQNESDFDPAAFDNSIYRLSGGDEGTYREEFLTLPWRESHGTETIGKEGQYEVFFKGEFQHRNATKEEADSGIVAIINNPNNADEFRNPQNWEVKPTRIWTVGKTLWQDGHSAYSDIENPIVRIRYDERTLPDGSKIGTVYEFQPPSKENQEKMPEWAKKRWRELGAKHMFRVASERNWSKLTWATGEQVAGFYGLSKQVEAITYSRRGNDYLLFIYPKEGEPIERKLKSNDLEAWIGKEASNRILSSGKSSGELRSLDLKVGGEGIKRIYDQDMINVFNNLGKKWNTKVEDINIPVRETRLRVETPDNELPSKEDVSNKLQEIVKSNKYDVSIEEAAIDVNFEINKGIKLKDALEKYGNIVLAEKLGIKMAWNRDIETKVHSMDISPKLKYSTMYEGQELFSMPWFNPKLVIDAIRDTKTDIESAMPHLKNLGVRALQEGKIKLVEWKVQMKSWLGDMWNTFKSIIFKVYNQAIKFNKSLGKSGLLVKLAGEEKKWEDMTFDEQFETIKNVPYDQLTDKQRDVMNKAMGTEKDWEGQGGGTELRLSDIKNKINEVINKLKPNKTETKILKETVNEGGLTPPLNKKETITIKKPLKNQDISYIDFIKPVLAVGYKYKHMEEPTIKANDDELTMQHNIIKDTNEVIDIFQKVEKPNLIVKLFGKTATDIRGIDDMIIGKKNIPEQLKGLVSDLSKFLERKRQEIIAYKKEDIMATLSPKQKEYFDWIENGKAGDKPKNLRKSTITVVEDVRSQLEDLKKWGLLNYFPRIFKGQYRYLDSNGNLVALGGTAKQAKADLMEKLEERPELKDQTLLFTNDYYEYLTLRKYLKPGVDNPISYLATKLSRKGFFRLDNEVRNLIKEELKEAGVDDVKGIKIDMTGIATIMPGQKYSPHFQQRLTEMKGQEEDPLKAMMSYIYSVDRKLGMEKTKKYLYRYAENLPYNMQRSKKYLTMLADNIGGRYNIIDRITDDTIGKRLGTKPFLATRLMSKAMTVQSIAKLGYAPVKTAVNRVGGVFHTLIKVGTINYKEGITFLKTEEGKKLIDEIGYLGGMEQSFSTSGIDFAKISKNLIMPLGSYQKAEIKNRSGAIAAGYVQGLKMYNGNKALATQHAIELTRLTQGLYNTAAMPVVIRGPILRGAYQFKQYLNNEIRFMSSLTPAQWAKYIPGLFAMGGLRGTMMTIKSFPLIGLALSTLGLQETLDDMMEWTNTHVPVLHKGLPALAGLDVSGPATWQLPNETRDWLGTTINDAIKSGEMLVKGAKNNGWTDKEINNYYKQLVPVGWNMWKGIQMLTEGKTMEGSRLIYKGDKMEGIINLLGAKSIGQSQAMDTTRYMLTKREDYYGKLQVLKEDYYNAKSSEEKSEAWRAIRKFVKPRNYKEFKQLKRSLIRGKKERELSIEERTEKILPLSIKHEIEE